MKTEKPKVALEYFNDSDMMRGITLPYALVFSLNMEITHKQAKEIKTMIENYLYNNL